MSYIGTLLERYDYRYYANGYRPKRYPLDMYADYPDTKKPGLMKKSAVSVVTAPTRAVGGFVKGLKWGAQMRPYTPGKGLIGKAAWWVGNQIGSGLKQAYDYSAEGKRIGQR